MTSITSQEQKSEQTAPHNTMEATYQCGSCLKKTIEGRAEADLPEGMVPAASDCAPGHRHTWKEIAQAGGGGQGQGYQDLQNSVTELRQQVAAFQQQVAAFPELRQQVAAYRQQVAAFEQKSERTHWIALFSSSLSSRLFCLSSAPSKRDEYGEYSELSQQAFPSSASSSPPYTKTSTQFAGLSKRPRKGYSSSLDKDLHK
jgi:hypothetical protein